MRIVRYRQQGGDRLGLVAGGMVADLEELASDAGRPAACYRDVQEVLEGGEVALDELRGLAQRLEREPPMASIPLSSARLRPPLQRVSKIIAVGLNYVDHAEEAGLALPKEPLIFAKWPSSINGPNDAIELPEPEAQVDFEAELAVIIGKTARGVRAAEAMEVVAGFMVLNDISARRFQFADKQWTRAKSCDTFTPIGPWLTTADEISDPHALRVNTRVNGELMQDSSTRNLIFGVPVLVEYISRHITLEPGDIIATGTPAGVGVFRKPPRFLQPGDVVETEIEGLGTLRNAVIAKFA